MNPWRGIGRLPKEIWILCGTTLINRMGSMGLPFLVVYLTRGEGYSLAEAGFVFSVYGIAALAFSDWFGMKILELYNAPILWIITFIACIISSFFMLLLRERQFRDRILNT